MKNQLWLIPVAVGLLSACSGTQKTSPTVQVEKTTATSGLASFDPTFLDKTVRPQDDFFMFANGAWIKSNTIPASESRWGSFNELEKSNEKKLLAILKRVSSSEYSKGSVEQIIGSYFQSFMNESKRQEMGIGEIKDDYGKIQSLKTYSEIAAMIGQLHQQGVSTTFSFGVGQDLKDVSKHITYLSQGGTGLRNRDYYLKDDKEEIRVAYKRYITKLLTLVGKNPTEAAGSAEQILKMETILAQSMMSPAELRVPEKSYNKMALADVQRKMRTFNFESYLNRLGSKTMDTLVVGQPQYLETVEGLVRSMPIEVWQDYLSFSLLNSYAPHLTNDFVELHFSFYQGVLSGKSEMKSPQERIIQELTGMSIGEGLGKLFVEEHYSENAQKRVNEMVDNLLLTFEERINNLTWMSPKTKKEALIKLKSIGRKLGFPSKWEDFSDLAITSDNYVRNVKACNMRDVRKNLDELYKPVDKEKWGMPAHMVNAYYHPLLNEIAFPAGIMQPPFFDENAEDAVNYGRIGMVIGHEFVHGFDDMGSKFAADGSFTNWWSEEDRRLFEEKTKLLGETFSGFCPVDGHCVNPDLTMGENIADLGGITLAYYAYAKTDEFKSGKLINGYTPAQRFFLSFAQLWKIMYTDEELKNRIANDPHSPGMYRVNGPLMNCPEFFEAFGIKPGDAMRNDEKKIARIW